MRTPMRFILLSLAVLLALALVGCAGEDVATPEPPAPTPEAEPAAPAPDVITLPNGWRPEGIASDGDFIFVGSIPTGAVFRAEVSTGQGGVLVQPREGRAAIGLKVDDQSRIFVAGGPTGKGFVYDAEAGTDIAEFTLTTAEETFINDVVLTEDAAWFTDSRNPVLYRVAIAEDGSLGGQDTVSTLELSGDFEFQPDVNNMNGIAWTGERLICIQSATGTLFSVDPESGVTTRIDLAGESMERGDGLLLEDRTLFVVQNRLNQVAVIDMGADFLSGTLRTRLTNPRFDVPTTIAAAGESLYLPNARFGIEPSQETTFAVIRLDRP